MFTLEQKAQHGYFSVFLHVMKIVIAIDSFKGCMTSEEVERCFSQALAGKGADTVSIPVSDGGEGMLDAFMAALGGKSVETAVHDPMMRHVSARYGITPDGTAVIETSQACGLGLIAPSERNPLTATTYGVGEMVGDAFRSGCRKFIIGLGGSGTSDAGIGMLTSLAGQFADGGLIQNLPGALSDCTFILASDVRNPLYGPDGAAYVFAPQKGAGPEMMAELDRRAMEFASWSAEHLGHDESLRPGAGAAGGLGYAFMQYLGAVAESGADLLLEMAGFDDALEGAAAVITGEGHADRQTLMGKLPERILRKASCHGVPVWLIAGRVSDRQLLLDAGFERADSITPEWMDTNEAIKPDTARENIQRWVRSNF